MKVTPMSDDVTSIFTLSIVTQSVMPPDAAAIAPSPSIVTSAPDPDPPGTITVPMRFSPGAVAALRKAGFLVAAHPAVPADIEAAVFGMLTAAWRAGVRAPEASSSSPAEAS